MVRVQLDPVVTIEAELLGSRVRLVPLIRARNYTYSVTVVLRGLMRKRGSFWSSPQVALGGSGVPERWDWTFPDLALHWS